jgi:hypothetical protein
VDTDVARGLKGYFCSNLGGTLVRQVPGRYPVLTDIRNVAPVADLFDGGDVMGRFPGDKPLGRKLFVGPPEDGEPPGHGARLHAGFQQCLLVALHVVGRDVERVNALRPHVPHEVRQIPAVSWLPSPAVLTRAVVFSTNGEGETV